MKTIKKPVYVEKLECENCGTRWLKNIRHSGAEWCKCWVCKKEGCGECSTCRNPTGKKYYYHIKCEEGLPKSVLKAMKKLEDEYNRQQSWGNFVNDRGY